MKILQITTPKAEWFSQQLLAWYDVHGRHALPWKSPNTPYRIWLSEVMLQQTQVKTVLPYFERFTERFDSVAAIANADLDEILHLWTGLGYYARGRSLHKAAQWMVEHHQGQIPRSLEALMELPGIGRSTAGAILAQAYELRAPILEGNVKRVLSRFTALPGYSGEPTVERSLWKLSEHFTPHHRLNDYTQAIMDLGATLCTLSKPACERCPLQTHCKAYLQGQTHIFPFKKAKRVNPVKEKSFACVMDIHHRVFLIQPSQTGLWGGLWQFPEVSDLNTTNLQYLSTLPAQRHTFSHYHLDYTIMLYGCKAPQHLEWPGLSVWHDEGDKRGLPAPIEKFLSSKSRQAMKNWYTVSEHEVIS